MWEVSRHLRGPDTRVDKPLRNRVGVYLAVYVGKYGVHLGRFVRKNIIPHPVDQTFAGFDMSGLRWDKVTKPMSAGIHKCLND